MSMWGSWTRPAYGTVRISPGIRNPAVAIVQLSKESPETAAIIEQMYADLAAVGIDLVTTARAFSWLHRRLPTRGGQCSRKVKRRV